MAKNCWSWIVKKQPRIHCHLLGGLWTSGFPPHTIRNQPPIQIAEHADKIHHVPRGTQMCIVVWEDRHTHTHIPWKEFGCVGHSRGPDLTGPVAEVESVPHQTLAQVQWPQELEASRGLLTLITVHICKIEQWDKGKVPPLLDRIQLRIPLRQGGNLCTKDIFFEGDLLRPKSYLWVGRDGAKIGSSNIISGQQFLKSTFILARQCVILLNTSELGLRALSSYSTHASVIRMPHLPCWWPPHRDLWWRYCEPESTLA